MEAHAAGCSRDKKAMKERKREGMGGSCVAPPARLMPNVFVVTSRIWSDCPGIHGPVQEQFTGSLGPY